MARLLPIFLFVLPILCIFNQFLLSFTDNKFIASMILNTGCFMLFLRDFPDILWFIFTYLTLVIHTNAPSIMPYFIVAKLLLFMLDSRYRPTTLYKSVFDFAIISVFFAPTLSLVTFCSLASLIHNMILVEYNYDEILHDIVPIWCIPIGMQIILLAYNRDVFLIFDLMNVMGFYTLWDTAFYVSYHLHLIN